MGWMSQHEMIEDARWEPPRSSTAISQTRPARQMPAGLRLDVGWLIATRLLVASLYLAAAAWPQRLTLLVLVTGVACVCLLAASPWFRLPLRLRRASAVEAMTIGLVSPFAAVQAYVASSGATMTTGEVLLALETGIAITATMMAGAALVERHSDIWSPLARSLVLWPLLVVPSSVLPSAQDGSTRSLSLALGGGFLAAAFVTVVARLAPAAAARWVIAAGTLAYGTIILINTGATSLWNRPLFASVLWVLEVGVACSLFSVAARQWWLRVLQAIRFAVFLTRPRR
ncbi:hypothetical protein NET03_11335 [Thermomicrobium sp. CFH 73360]|uniref:hypothetical protein n=1 Tax=Thermomicrobium sp. CFH 73360 TaxID=2951987 RepID=UPI0020772B62|nr:hypothetical protein [Thermomicrobium sp. CFH 73360]MCM8747118.1 hypothetical protein [Thermomicrobium sp. CFH 73360]